MMYLSGDRMLMEQDWNGLFDMFLYVFIWQHNIYGTGGTGEHSFYEDT